MDNGYMLFDKYRVPHFALLSWFSQLDAMTGQYSAPANRAVMYGSMTFARTYMINNARLVLARAVTIAVRYTSIRHQFTDRDKPSSKNELAVLSYSTVQIRLFPLLATVFALHSRDLPNSGVKKRITKRS